MQGRICIDLRLTVAALCLAPLTALGQQQLTRATSGDSLFADIDDAGSRIVFQSSADLDNSGNSDGSVEIFMIDADGSDVTQLTDSAQGISQQPAISGDGQRIVFVSNADLAGSNADGNSEIFLIDVASGGITQITDTTGATAFQNPGLSANGERLVFSATGNLESGENNVDGSREIFAVDTDGGNFVQLSSGPVNSLSQFPAISADGSQVVFTSNANLDGDNGDGSNEIFSVPADGASGPRQLTSATQGQSRRPDIDAGGRIVFESSADLDGNNGDGNFELFAMDADGSNLTQLTDAATGDSGFARIAANGGQVVFQSNSNLDGDNSDGSNEIFLVDSDGASVTQITRFNAFLERAVLSGDGGRIVFQTAADLTGNNPEGNVELFVTDPQGGNGNGGSGGNADDDEDRDNRDTFGCLLAPSGCSLCEEEENDDDNEDDSNPAVTPPTDPTLALMTLLAGCAVARRRRR